MPITIRHALPQDAQAITGLIAVAFHEEANPVRIQALIEGGKHLTFVAEDNEILGFIDGFYTNSQDARCRLELDLAAVHPNHSGKGIGKALIRAFGKVGDPSQSIRALVAVTNTAMHHAMEGMGYELQAEKMSLYIASKGMAQKSSHQAHCIPIPVETFTYTGVWLEGKVSKEAIHDAHTLRQSKSLEIVGAVIPSDAHENIEILKASDFEFIKEFQWWVNS